MGRATQFIEFINTKRLADKDPLWYKTVLTHITIDDRMKKARKNHLKKRKKRKVTDAKKRPKMNWENRKKL